MLPIKTTSSNHNFGPPPGREGEIGDLPCEIVDYENGDRYVSAVWRLVRHGGFPPVSLGDPPDAEPHVPAGTTITRDLLRLGVERRRTDGDRQRPEPPWWIAWLFAGGFLLAAAVATSLVLAALGAYCWWIGERLRKEKR
jgi:hypothetical protein